MTSTPLPEQGGFNERLDEALALIKYSVEYRETHRGCPPEVSAIKRHGVAEAKAAIRTLIAEEIIGRDEMSYPKNIRPMTPLEQQHAIARNSFRIKQRKRLEDTHGTK